MRIVEDPYIHVYPFRKKKTTALIITYVYLFVSQEMMSDGLF